METTVQSTGADARARREDAAAEEVRAFNKAAGAPFDVAGELERIQARFHGYLQDRHPLRTLQAMSMVLQLDPASLAERNTEELVIARRAHELLVKDVREDLLRMGVVDDYFVAAITLLHDLVDLQEGWTFCGGRWKRREP